jgi:hypothetical protein
LRAAGLNDFNIQFAAGFLKMASVVFSGKLLFNRWLAVCDTQAFLRSQ